MSKRNHGNYKQKPRVIGCLYRVYTKEWCGFNGE
jgi:hypothetical protein